nr:DNA-dependent RNA polymerase subunit beta - 1 [Chlorogonium euchlorum]
MFYLYIYILNMPIHRYFLSDFVTIQRQSFFQLLEKGLIEEFQKRNPITNLKRDLEIFFYPEHYRLTRPEYSPQAAILKNKSYTSKLFVPVQLTDKQNHLILLKWVYIGNLPIMTKRGHFILNGAARVIVNQILRSPGIYYQQKVYENYEEKWSQKPDDTYRRYYADLICMRGTWLRIEMDKEKNIWAQTKKGPKIPIYWFLLAMGLSEKTIFKCIRDSHKLLGNLENKEKNIYDTVNKMFTSLKTKRSKVKQKRIKGVVEDKNSEKKFNLQVEVKGTHQVSRLISDINFSLVKPEKHYFSSNKKQHYFYLKNPPEAWREIYALINKNKEEKNRNISSVPSAEQGRKWLYNRFLNPRSYDLGKHGRLSFNRKLGLNISESQTTLTGLDVLYATDYLIKVEKGLAKIDDIDHLKNRRVRTSGELIQIQIGVGLVRLEKSVRDILNKTSRLNFISQKSTTKTVLSPKSGQFNFTGDGEATSPKDAFYAFNRTPSLSFLGVHKALEERNSGTAEHNNLKPEVISSKQKLEERGQPKPKAWVGAGSGSGSGTGLVKALHLGTGMSIETDNQEGKGALQIKSSEAARYQTKNITNLTAVVRQHKISQVEHLNQKNILYTLTNTKAFNSAIREFFGTSPLSQFMDQINPLAELTHKRRLSSMGPGGVTRDTATLEIRGIHPTHYGRICPIETPEGKNTGLVNSMTTYARVNPNGIIESPFYKVYKGQVQKHTGMYYFSAEQEEKIKLAAADLSTSSIGFLPKSLIPVRIAEDFTKIPRSQVQYIGVSPLQMISIAASLIPFLEHDDANRALMGSNMQRQAVPLIRPERPIVGTGLEARAVSDSGHAIISKYSGLVTYVSAKKIVIHSFVFS